MIADALYSQLHGSPREKVSSGSKFTLYNVNHDTLEAFLSVEGGEVTKLVSILRGDSLCVIE